MIPDPDPSPQGPPAGYPGGHSGPQPPLSPSPSGGFTPTHTGRRIDRPFIGDYRGVTWNSQALFAALVTLQAPKQNFLVNLISSHDFAMLQETHSTPGAVVTWSPPAGTRYFASHGTSAVAGVGILLTDRFLRNFDPLPEEAHITSTHWEEIEPGRAACLHLTGPEGSLDLLVCYMHTGQARRERSLLRSRIARTLRPATSVLTIMAGDFNYAARTCDRWTKGSPLNPSRDPFNEEVDFMTTVADPFSLYEIHQPDFTHDCAASRARLDRVYTNQHSACQLDRYVSCTALTWQKALSDHRPLSFSRRTPSRGDQTAGPLSQQSLNHPEWASRVQLCLQELEATDTQPSSALRRGILCKRAMRIVSRTVHQEMTAHTPTTTADRLSWVMQFIRAIESHRWGRARHLASSYPDLAALIDLSGNTLHLDPGLNSARDLAVEMARTQLLEEIRDLQAQQPSLSDQQKTNRHQGIATKLRRLRPGASAALSSVQDLTGKICTEPGDIARALADHWSTTFQGQQVDIPMLEAWLRETLPNADRPDPTDPTALPPADSPLWQIRRRDIARAVRLSGNSAPGPDGIPYAAWRKMGQRGIDILWDMTRALTQPDATEALGSAYKDEALGSHDFNLGILCCLPKRPSGNTEEGTPFYAPANTRPLSIVNCDNRLIASAARIRWEAPFNRWVTQLQRGFLPQRSMLANVLDIDFEAMRVSLTCEAGAIVLFDFQAAFPSVSHEFIFRTLRHIGLPPEALQLVTSLYDQNKCLVSALGGLFPGFDMKSGIRQGCPLSPLLFVVVVDSLLRHIQGTLPSATTRAYADDIGLVTEDFMRDLPQLKQIFDRFHRVSGLQLNLPKTAIIPLGDVGPEALRSLVKEVVHQASHHGSPLPEDASSRHRKRPRLIDADTVVQTDQHPHPWAVANFTTWALYLGFATGPGKAHHSWDRPITNLRSRIQLWPWSTLGMQFAAHAYNVFAFPVMSFVAQLERPPKVAMQMERQALAQVVPGPHNWSIPEDLWRLQQCFGFPYKIRSLVHTATAAQLRVALWENRANGGIRLHERCRTLEGLLRAPDYPWRRWQRDDWHSSSHLLVLRQSWDRLRTMQLTPTSLFTEIAGTQRPWTRATSERVKSDTQKTLYAHCLAADPMYGHRRLAHKLERWQLDGNSRILADRVLPRLQDLRKMVPPRVQAAAFSTLWNRWTTTRRFQQVTSPHTGCLLGCAATRDLDSIEHYLRCPVVIEAAKVKLGMHLTPETSWDHLLLAGSVPDGQHAESWWARCALVLYATYRTTNAARHQGAMSPHTAIAALKQAFYEGAKNHAQATRLVDNNGLPGIPGPRRSAAPEQRARAPGNAP